MIDESKLFFKTHTSVILVATARRFWYDYDEVIMT